MYLVNSLVGSQVISQMTIYLWNARDAVLSPISTLANLPAIVALMPLSGANPNRSPFPPECQIKSAVGFAKSASPAQSARILSFTRSFVRFATRGEREQAARLYRLPHFRRILPLILSLSARAAKNLRLAPVRTSVAAFICETASCTRSGGLGSVNTKQGEDGNDFVCERSRSSLS